MSLEGVVLVKAAGITGHTAGAHAPWKQSRSAQWFPPGHVDGEESGGASEGWTTLQPDLGGLHRAHSCSIPHAPPPDGALPVPHPQ